MLSKTSSSPFNQLLFLADLVGQLMFQPPANLASREPVQPECAADPVARDAFSIGLCTVGVARHFRVPRTSWHVALPPSEKEFAVFWVLSSPPVPSAAFAPRSLIPFLTHVACTCPR